MIPVFSTIKTACNSDKLIYKEYITVDGQVVEIRGKMSNSCYNEGNIFGTFIMKKLEFTTENDIDFKQKEVTYYKSVNGESFKIGTYIVTEIKDNDSDETVTVTAYDYAIKTAITYDTNLDYASGEITLYDVLLEACNSSGLGIANESITNGDFIVDSNQFTDNQLTGEVIKAISHISGDFATINENDELEFVYEEETSEIIEDYENLADKRDTHPITSVSIGTSQVSGQEAILRDEDMIAEYGEHWLILNDNPFSYTLAKRQELVTAVFNKVKGFSYSSFESSYSFKPYLQLGDKIQFRNKNGDLISSRILRIDTDYDDIKLSAPSIIKATVDYANSPNAYETAKRAEVIANQNTASITLLAEEQSEQETRISQQQIDIEGISFNVSKSGGNNLIKNSDRKNGTNFWLEHLINPYIEKDTPPTENLYEGMYWYCSSNFGVYQQGIIYQYVDEDWVETPFSRKYLDDTSKLMQYTSQREDHYTRQNTVSNSMITFNAGTDLQCSHIFNCTNVIDIVKGQDYITLSFKLKNSMKTGVGYIALGFMDKYLDENATEVLYSAYEPSYLFTPDETRELTEVVITAKIPTKNDFLEVTASDIAPDTDKLWIDTSIMGVAGVLKEYVGGEWVRKLTTASCYDRTTRLVYPYRQIFDFWYATPIDFDNFELKCVYPAFTMYAEHIKMIPSATEPTPFKGAYWLALGGNVHRAKYSGNDFVEWEDTSITTEYVFTNTYPSPPFPNEYGVPCSGFYEVADIKAEWNRIATTWSAYAGETYGKNFKMDEKGLTISAGANTMFIDEDEIVAKFNDEEVFRISKDMVMFKKLLVVEQIQTGSYTQENRIINNKEYFLLY
jgi:hypothetical protein